MKEKAVKTISFMAVIILFAKFLGLFRETMIAGVFGQGNASDILNTATQIPLLFFDMTLGVAILSTFVPVFNGYLEKEGRERAEQFACNFISVVGLISIIGVAIGMIFAKPVLNLMVSGYTPEKIDETATLLRIIFPSIIFTGIAYIIVGILQSYGEFNVPSLISVVSNLIMIIYLFVFGKRLGLKGVIISMLIAWMSQVFFQLPSLKKKGFKYKFILNFKNEGIKKCALMAIPVLISSWVNPLCSVINMAFGSHMAEGTVSGLNWAYKIYIIMVGVFAYAITNFIFPKLSRMTDKKEEFADTARTSLSWVIFIITLIAGLFIALSEPVIRLIFERGEFTAENTRITATALFYYSFGMVGYAICEILNKSFYALRDGKTPMIASVIGVAINFVTALIFTQVFPMGIGGLALASAVSSIGIALILLYRINKKKQGTVTKNFIVNTAKVLLCGIASGIVAHIVYNGVKIIGQGFIYTVIELGISATVGLTVYIIAGIVLRTQEIKLLFKKVGKRNE